MLPKLYCIFLKINRGFMFFLWSVCTAFIQERFFNQGQLQLFYSYLPTVLKIDCTKKTKSL